jgi:hypothetical protein
VTGDLPCDGFLNPKPLKEGHHIGVKRERERDKTRQVVSKQVERERNVES